MTCFDIDDEEKRDEDGRLHLLIRSRKVCTDIFCLIIFVVFVGVMILTAAFAFVYGNPLRLSNGYDSFGNVCGTTNEPIGSINYTGIDMTNRKFVFFLSPLDISNSFKVCVGQCPDRDIKSFRELEQFTLETNSELCHVAKGTFKIDNASVLTRDQYICPDFPVYESVPLLKRCVPKSSKNVAFKIITNIHNYLNNIEFLQQLFTDFYTCWRTMLWLSFLALGLSFVMLMCIHWFTVFLLWGFFASLTVTSIAFTVALFLAFSASKKKLDETPEIERFDNVVRNETAFLSYSLIASVITVVLLLIMLSLRKKIEEIVKVFKEASSCIAQIPLLLIQPLWTCLLLFGFIAFWIYVMLLLSTADHLQLKRVFSVVTVLGNDSNLRTLLNNSGNVSMIQYETGVHSVEYKESSWALYVWCFYVIAFIWFCEFILACQQMVITGAVVLWYFKKNKNQKSSLLTTSFRRLCLYHIGTVALGSFLITLFKFPRIILTILYKCLKKEVPRSCEKCVSCCFCCCACCFWSLEKFIRYMNHNAYAVVVARGYSFCPSAKRAFDVVTENILLISTYDKAVDCILFFGKIIVSAMTGFVGLIIMKNDPNLYFYAGPLLVICLFAFFIADCFLSIYEMVMDTILICMCDDYYLNKDENIFNAPFKRLKKPKLKNVPEVSGIPLEEQQAVQ